MMQFPLANGSVLAVIEPGNIARLKEGRPLEIGNVCLCFTPDMKRFAESLGVPGQLPNKGERIETVIRITPEQIDAALQSCQKLPEVVR